MKHRPKRAVYFVLVLIAGTAVVHLLTNRNPVNAQSGTRSQQGSARRGQGDQSSTESRSQGEGLPAAQRPFEERFWEWLRGVEYSNWGSLPGRGVDYFPGESPHGAFLKLYVNRVAASDPQRLPYGSIIIKENYASDRQTLLAVTAMYRSKGFDPAHGDWYWVKYEPDGRVSQMTGMPIAGKVSMCIDCHGGAGGGDFVFVNDP